jgi:hypothetical protein
MITKLEDFTVGQTYVWLHKDAVEVWTYIGNNRIKCVYSNRGPLLEETDPGFSCGFWRELTNEEKGRFL